MEHKMARDNVRRYLLPSLVILMDGNAHTKDEFIRRLPSAQELWTGLRRHRQLNNNIEKLQAVLNEYVPPSELPEEHIEHVNKNIDSLMKGKLIESAGRDLVKITQKGQDLLAKNPALIDIDCSLGDVYWSKSANNPEFELFGELILKNKDVKSR